HDPCPHAFPTRALPSSLSNTPQGTHTARANDQCAARRTAGCHRRHKIVLVPDAERIICIGSIAQLMLPYGMGIAAPYKVCFRRLDRKSTRLNSSHVKIS